MMTLFAVDTAHVACYYVTCSKCILERSDNTPIMGIGVKYPCSVCGTGCGPTSCIECSGCMRWVHKRCTPGITDSIFKTWGSEGLQFRCNRCTVDDNGKYDVKAAICR